jgi:N-methylhydantoinase A
MDPGPICFGRGTLPTVTDANLILGRLDLTTFLDGGVQLDLERTRRIMAEHKGPLPTIEAFASGILRVIEAQMEKAIRVISIERGHDPRDFTLVPFGGGGPLHACALAQALRIPNVLIPNLPGALSAAGILLADNVRDYSQTLMLPGSAINNLADAFTSLEHQASADFAAESLQGTAQRTLDLRYRGQGYELNVPYNPSHPTQSLEAFHALHLQRYGFSNPDKPIEIVNLRLRMIAAAEPYTPTHIDPSPNAPAPTPFATKPIFFNSRFLPSHLYHRSDLRPGHTLPGPAMITEYTSATILPPNCTARVDGFSNLLIHTGEEPA